MLAQLVATQKQLELSQEKCRRLLQIIEHLENKGDAHG